MTQVWVGIKRDIGKNGRGGRQGDGHTRVQGGKIVSGSMGKIGVLIEHYQKLGTATMNKRSDAEFEKQITREQRQM